MVENDAFRDAAKNFESLSITSSGNNAHESARALFRGDTRQFTQHARVVGVIVGIRIRGMWFVGCVARGMNARGSAKRIYFQPGIVSQNEPIRNAAAVLLGFFAGIGFKCVSVFYD